jgi:hypothetical protein
MAGHTWRLMLGQIGRQSRPNAVRRDFHLFSGAGIEPDGTAGGSFLHIQAMRRDQGGSRGLERRAVVFLDRSAVWDTGDGVIR